MLMLCLGDPALKIVVTVIKQNNFAQLKILPVSSVTTRSKHSDSSSETAIINPTSLTTPLNIEQAQNEDPMLSTIKEWVKAKKKKRKKKDLNGNNVLISVKPTNTIGFVMILCK
jgi:hypothetical protein